MRNSKSLILLLLMLFTASFAYSQTEALKSVVNNLAFYKQRSELKYLSKAKKSVDSLIVTRSDSNNLAKNVYKAIVYSSIAYIDSTNQLNVPADFVSKTVKLVDTLEHRKNIYKYQAELDFSKRCLANYFIRTGFGHLTKQEYNKAIGAFRKAQQYAPGFNQINSYVAYANAKSGNYEGAIKYYNTLITPDSAKAEYVITVANLYKSMKDTAKAVQVFETGRKILPNDRMLLTEEANLLNNIRDYKMLEPLLVRLLDANPKDAGVAFLAANCYDQLKKYDRAESLYLRAIEINNSGYNAVFNLGLLYLKLSALKPHGGKAQENLARAGIWLRKAYEMSPKNVVNLQLLQLVYAKSGNEIELININNKLQQLNN